jgi:CrcB protein
VKFGDIVRVMIGAGVGGALRYVVGGWIGERWGASFPWNTLVVNLTGAFLLGVLLALNVERGIGPASLRLWLGIGLLGGYTTFSTLSFESVALLERGLYVQGAANMFGSGLLGLVAAIAGLALGRSI